MRQLKLWQADMLLVLLTVWWGFSNVAMNYCLKYTDAFTLNAFRFFLGGIIVLPFCYKRLRLYLNRKSIKWGIWIGLWLFMTYACATFGVQNTTIANTGFLCGLCIIFTPIINAIITGHFPHPKTILSIVLSFVGVALLTLGEGFSINMSTIKGDMLCVGCSIAYAVDLVLTDKLLRNNPSMEGMINHKNPEYADPLCVGVVSIFAVAIMNLCLSLGLYDAHLPKDTKFYLVAIFLAIFCTGLPFIIQPFAQQFTSANRVGIIFTLEPVFNAILAITVAGEILSSRQYIGGAMMLISVIIIEVDLRQLFLKS